MYIIQYDMKRSKYIVQWSYMIMKYVLVHTLFRNKRFVLNLMLKRNTSKFAIFLS